MEVTSANVYPVDDDDNDRLLAFSSVVFDDEFVVHNVRLIEADSRTIVAMPNEEFKGEYRDIAHPISNQCRDKIRQKVIEQYNEKVDGHEKVEPDS
jgi:stage V sporulation protein G